MRQNSRRNWPNDGGQGNLLTSDLFAELTSDYPMIKHSILRIILIAADILGLNYLFRAINANKVRVLMYHGISPVKLPDVYWLHIELERFQRQMNYLKARYNVRPVTMLYGQTENSDAPLRNGVVITFDDGLQNVYTTAWPLLKNLRLPAVCFVVPGLSEGQKQIWSCRLFELILKTPHTNIDLTSFGLERYDLEDDVEHRATVAEKIMRVLKELPKHTIDTILDHVVSHFGQEVEFDEGPFRLMNVKQIKEIAQSKEFDVGAHTYNHTVLSLLARQQQRKEITQSMDKLDEWGIQQVPVFCYPSGRFNKETITLLREAGIKAAVGTEDGLHDLADDKYNIKRISVGPDTELWEFKARLSGLFYFLMKLIGHGQVESSPGGKEDGKRFSHSY